MNKLLVVALFLSFNLSAGELTQITGNHGDVKGNSFTDKVDLEFVLTSEQTKDGRTNEVDGLYTSLKNSILYKATENDEFRLYASAVWETNDSRETNSYWELAEIMYRRKNILNEKDHFVNLEAELKNYWVLDENIRERRWGFDSAFIPQLIFTRSISKNSGAKIKIRKHMNNRNNRSAGSLTGEDRIYASAYYMYKHFIIFNAEMKYRHKSYAGDHFSHSSRAMVKKNVELTTLRPSLMVFLSRKALVEGYVESLVGDSTNNKTVSELIDTDFKFGAALYLTAF